MPPTPLATWRWSRDLQVPRKARAKIDAGVLRQDALRRRIRERPRKLALRVSINRVGVKQRLRRSKAGRMLNGGVAVGCARQERLMGLQPLVGQVSENLVKVLLWNAHLRELLTVDIRRRRPEDRIVVSEQIVHRVCALLEDLAMCRVQIGLLVL